MKHVWFTQATGAPQPQPLQVCTPLPEHCVEPGVQPPTQDPPRHDCWQPHAVVHWPLALQIWTMAPRHCVVPGEHPASGASLKSASPALASDKPSTAPGTASLAESAVPSFTPESSTSGPDAVSEDVSPFATVTSPAASTAATAAPASPEAAHRPKLHARAPPVLQTPTGWSGRITRQQGSPGPPQLVVPSWLPASLPGEP